MGTPEEQPHSLAPGHVGAAAVTFFALAASAPISVLITSVPAAYSLGGGPLVPLSFLALGAVLLVFTGGYAAMANRLPYAGALYTYVSRGLGRPAGTAAAWLAIGSYQAIQLGFYSLVGAAAAPLLRDWFDVAVPWWQVAAAGWLVVALCGTIRIEVTSGLLALLVLAEAAVVTGYTAANLFTPAAGGFDAASIVPSSVDRPVLGLLLAVGVLAFIGFETTGAYAEEAMRPRRETGHAAYASIGILTVLFAVSAWSVSVAAGPGRVAALARGRGWELVFDLAAARLTPWAVTLGRLMLVTGLIAAALALHHTIARYLFALGREHVLPDHLGRTSRRTRAPRTASLTQSALAGLALVAFYLADPVLPTVVAQRLAVAGGLGILLVLLATSVAALLHLNRVPKGEGPWSRFVAPALATVALGSVAWLAFGHLPAMLGVAPRSTLVWIAPAALGGAVLLGLLHAAALRGALPVTYAGIGQGGVPVVVTPPSLTEHGDPGRHRPDRVKR